MKSIDLARVAIISLRGAAGHTVHAREGAFASRAPDSP